MKLIAILSLLLSFNAFANGLDVQVSQDEKQITVNVKTEVRSSMCRLHVTSLEFKEETNGFRGEVTGTIEVNFEQNPMSVCLMAFGPHRGSLTLEKGYGLPKLAKGGTYQLIVNGEEYPQLITVK